MVENKNKLLEWLDNIYIGILLVIFGGIVLHAPISVGLTSLSPNFDLLIKSWKEILMLVAGVILLVILYKTKQFKVLRDPIIIAIAAYATLHLGLLAYNFVNFNISAAGLAIDLRYVLYFSLVYIAMRLYPGYRNIFIKIGIIGALVVLVFAVLQVTILPDDVLKYIGYNSNTISSYLTVDQNSDFIRINSTLRGPNPLGAYAGIVLALIAAAFVREKVKKDNKHQIIAAILSVGGLVALWFSYSRSALIAALVAVAIVAFIGFYKYLTPKSIAIGFVIILLSCGGLFLMRDNSFISNVLLHDNPNDNNSINSNEGHASSIQDGMKQMVNQPLGAGIGSTGSASLLGNQPEIIENQYLFIAHEAGWLGLGLFSFIFIVIMNRLWKLRSDWLALGVFASGIGLLLIGLLLPVWADDTVAVIWWGLAAIIVGSRSYIVSSRNAGEL